MFVVVIAFPPIKAGKDAEFRQWFGASNQVFSKFKGFISRKLLKPVEGGNYAAVVEFSDQAAFQAMHSSADHEQAGARVKPLFDGKPKPTFYEVISE
jgi:heme-degrading monooxygenase HmoA